jgi:hypothetical protein
LILSVNSGVSQTKLAVDELINEIVNIENSALLTQTISARKIKAYGENVLPLLADIFTDSTKTKVRSYCHSRKLTKGEVAIILADFVKHMPYALLTGIQNCTMEYCPNNPNKVEFYLRWNNNAQILTFQEKYRNYLNEKQ